MKEKLLKYFERFISYLQRIHIRLSASQELHAYTSLSPVDDADNDGKYAQALLWALKNRKEKDIKNIAITGPYGSGKSSVLKTFQKRFGGKDLKFLNISLATFKDEISSDEQGQGKPGNNSNDNTSKEEMLRLIELSILQQIFYHEKDSKIPDSRFKKIKRHSRVSIIFTTLCWSLFALSAINLIYTDFVTRILNGYELSKSQLNIIHLLSLTLSLSGFVYLIAKSIRILSKVKLKLSITDTEIEIDENISKSILNHHIDELLYFFEATPYNVVIIEDLDRFNQTEIFTKLREINLLLNNSKKVNKDIVFIYAVRDDMFKDKERAKFFDFIVPIIPVINASNSSQKLLEYREVNKYEWRDDLIEDIAIFISDMRLLHNIVNEFHLYKSKLSKELDQNKLLAILIYKNIFPGDFSQLSEGEGRLYNSLHNKKSYILTATKKVNENIEIIKEEISSIENIEIKNIQELRSLYILRYVERLKGMHDFVINGYVVTSENMTTDENFDYLIGNRASYQYPHYSSIQTSKISERFEAIEKSVDPDKNYSTRLKEIRDWHDGKVNKLKKQIQELEIEKATIRNYKIKEILAKDPSIFGTIDDNQKALVNVLIRNGYIDENYFDYISLFYEGTLTKRDYQFLLNVKSQRALEYDFQLNKVEDLVKRINSLDFDKEYLLNYQVVEFLLSSKIYDAQLNRMLHKLSDESEASVKFVDGMIFFANKNQNFIILICKKWPNIWNYIQTKSLYPDEKRREYFRLIIENAEISDIQVIASKSDLRTYILSDKHFLNIIPDETRVINIIKVLNLLFTEIDENSLSTSFLNHIYENSYYQINEYMIRLLIKKKGTFNQASFDTKNYSAITNSGCNELISYINDNLDLYIKDVYLKIETNDQEDENLLIILLNSKVTLENKHKILLKIKNQISDISEIEDLTVMELLFKENKVIPTWDNIFHYFVEAKQEISDSLIEFIDQDHVMSKLSKKKIPTGGDDESLTGVYKNFILKLTKSEEISDQNYALMLQSLPYSYTRFTTEDLNSNKIISLIKTKTIRLSKENFLHLKEKGEQHHIRLMEHSNSDLLKDISSYELDNSDVLSILKSNSLSDELKAELLSKIDKSIILSSANILQTIGSIAVKNNSFVISEEVLKRTLCSNSLLTETKVKIFNDRFERLDSSFITEFLNSLGEPYSNIALVGKKPSLPDTVWNLKFANILESKKYISSYEPQAGKGIRINTFKKEQ